MAATGSIGMVCRFKSHVQRDIGAICDQALDGRPHFGEVDAVGRDGAHIEHNAVIEGEPITGCA